MAKSRDKRDRHDKRDGGTRLSSATGRDGVNIREPPVVRDDQGMVQLLATNGHKRNGGPPPTLDARILDYLARNGPQNTTALRRVLRVNANRLTATLRKMIQTAVPHVEKSGKARTYSVAADAIPKGRIHIRRRCTIPSDFTAAKIPASEPRSAPFASA